MPWMSLIMALITFLTSKSSGASTGKAAALAAGVGLATYYTADPSNKDNLLGLTYGKDSTGEDSLPKISAGSTNETKVREIPSTLGSLGSTVISESAGVLKSWGPTGSLAVVAGTTALASKDWKKYLPWALGALALYMVTK